MNKAFVPFLGATVLAACAVGPDFKPPAAPQTDRYTAEALPDRTASTPVVGGESQSFAVGQALPPQWWKSYGSDTLDALVQQAFAGSPNLAAAQAALRQAQENLRASRSGLFPSLDGKADVQREKFSPAAFGGSAGSGSIFTLYDVSASVSYALDLFGGVRRGIEAQAAQAEYQQFQTLATYQTLAANVVTSAVKEASLRAQLGATNKVIEALQEQLQLTERQAELGGAAYAEVLTARSNLASVQATVPGLQQQQSAAQHQLAVYLGKTPSEFTSSGLELAALRLPQEIPVSLPSELVRQRPDVRAAEASLHQASAEVGVATANLLPQISISGSYGGQANKSSDLFSSGASVWNIGAGITQPLFHAGELTARRRAAIAAYDQAAANYRLTVLQAFQNVADSLRALDNDAQALAAQYTAAGSAEESLRLLQKQYELGGASYLQLLTAQKQYQQTQIDYVRALAARYQDTAALFQALGGGGWAEATTTASTR